MRRKEKEDIDTRRRSRKIAVLAELAAMSAAPIPDTWPARMPAYCYTALCPDEELKQPAKTRGSVERKKGRNDGKAKKHD